ncbi:MAG: polysaccharide deacetylase family protein, partial [Bacteroidales bacterium]|nr:polysaccharide deacetylase family protein [Bacteroidales bacterium]
VLTFDDGYYDFFENAMNVLTKYNVSAVQHLISNCVEIGDTFWTQKLNKLIEYAYTSKQKLTIFEIDVDLNLTKESQLEKVALLCFKRLAPMLDKEKIINNLSKNLGGGEMVTKMMSWNEVIECSNNNIYFGSHTQTHQNLSVLNEVDLHNEIGLSVGSIRSKIGNCVSLAFPNGYYSVDTIKVALDYNVPFLFTTEKEHLIPNVNANIITRYSLYHTEWWKNYIRLRFLI